MWDLQKTLNHVAGVRRRIAKGLPAYTMTDEERAASDKTHAEIRAAMARTDAEFRKRERR